MACSCIPCDECKGTGSIWFSISGEYLGHHRCDDLDQMDICPDCDGEGIVSLCDECREAYEEDRENWE